MPSGVEDFELPSDRLICSARRSYLEERGVRFAPRSLALEFSTEQVGGELPSFGFHGRAVSAAKYRRGWGLINARPQPPQQNFTKIRNQAVPLARLKAEEENVQAAAISYRDNPPVINPAEGESFNTKAAAVYVFPVKQGQQYVAWAKRFVDCYLKFPANYPHILFIVLNGGHRGDNAEALFAPLAQLARFVYHDNSGYDIGAFQRVARENPQFDLMVFFGSSTYLKGTGWMVRAVQAQRKHGPGIYGCMGNMGDGRFKVFPHIRTTGFWMPPTLLNKYPHRVTRPGQRYEFEHGRTCLAEWARTGGLRRMIVTWDREYEYGQWDSIPNGYHRGDQSAMLFGDRLTEPPFYAIA